jgi:hypothetical protein
MRINEALNIVMPLYDDDTQDNVIGWVHSVPIPRLMFEAHYKLLAATLHEITPQGLFGMRTATLTLRDISREKRLDADGFLNEVKRLSTFAGLTAAGWETMPLDDAIQHHRISEEDEAEVLNALVVFIAASALMPRAEVRRNLPGIMSAWNARTTSLGSTAWVASLTTSTAPVLSAPTQFMVNGRPN